MNTRELIQLLQELSMQYGDKQVVEVRLTGVGTAALFYLPWCKFKTYEPIMVLNTQGESEA